MVARSLVASDARTGLDVGDAGRRAAQLAAGLTIGGAATLAAFFAVGEPWGTLNDIVSIGLAWATVPIAVDLARRHRGSRLQGLGVAADLVGVATVTAFTSLLISRRLTFEDSLPPILAGQAFIGAWLILAGAGAWSDNASRRMAMLGIAGGAGLVASTVGVATGGMGSPLASIGFASALVGTLGFYGLLGRRHAR